MRTYLAVDRIEGTSAICEWPDKTTRAIPLAELPDGVREGDCLYLQDGAYLMDPDEANRRRAYNRQLLNRLLGKE